MKELLSLEQNNWLSSLYKDVKVIMNPIHPVRWRETKAYKQPTQMEMELLVNTCFI